MQHGFVCFEDIVTELEFPSPETELLPGIPWGALEAFPSPAYWAYQIRVRKLSGKMPAYQLGETLKEEVGACLLGGHGIPAQVGLAAFQKLKKLGVFNEQNLSEAEIYDLLSSPFEVGGRNVKYRFARQKSKYLYMALKKLNSEKPILSSGKELRSWLLEIPGIGLKTASWIARNWLGADDVAILDIHILRAGLLSGIFQENLTVQRDYLKLEEQFIAFSHALDVRPSELDSLIWLEMMSAPRTVKNMLDGDSAVSGTRGARSRTNKSHSNTNQAVLFV